MTEFIKDFDGFLNEEESDTYRPGETDVFADIKSSTDIEYLKELDKYVDEDIENKKKESDKMKSFHAKLHGISVEKYEKQTNEYLNSLKNAIQERLKEIK